MSNAPRAAVYCRISRDPEGLRAGVERQEEDCRKLAKHQGYDVVGVFTDNDISASTFSKKVRPQYAAMLNAARAGELDVIVAYSNSRLTRRLLELEDLIRLHEQHGTRIETVVSGQDDLSTADGRMVARIKASVDSAEAERTGERLRRAHLQRAQRGATNHGGRPFGWADDKLAPHPDEAELIRQAARDVINGVPLRTIAAAWNTAGVATSRDKAWTHTTVRRLLARPRLAGWRTHHDAIVRDAAGRPVRGEWEPILDQDTHDAVQAVFQRDGRGGGRRGARRYLLTGVLRCGTCGARMNGTATRTGHAYTCSGEPANHSVTITGPQTEAAVLALVRARLADETLPATPAAAATAPTAARVEQIGQLLAELMGAYRAGQLSAAIVFPQVEALEAERAELEAERARTVAASAMPTVAGVEQLDALDLDRQRAVLETLFEAVVVQPAGRRGEPWTPERLTFVWRRDS